MLFTSDFGLTSFDPKRGDVLWQHDWSTTAMGVVRIVQPAVVADNDVLLGTGMDMGTQRVHVSKEGDAWKTTVKWTKRSISPYYSDLVIHNDCLYGFEGEFFTCVNLENGATKWRARGYGLGQVLLLADQNLLLVLTQSGKVALLEANPQKCTEIASLQAFNKKTWNHPVIAHGKLFVRNAEEAVCYQLTEIVKVNSEKAQEKR